MSTLVTGEAGGEQRIQCVEVTRPRPGVAMLRLDRPDVLNALNLRLRQALAARLLALESDGGVRAIVLAGHPKAFCAGADLTEYVGATPENVIAREMDRLWGAVAHCRKPLIAAVRGHALGGGCELALHADLIVAGNTARFGQPEVLLGLMPGGGATQRLTRCIGKARAMQMMLTGEPVSASLALEWGLINEVTADDAVETRALDMAERIAQLPTLAVRFIKEAVIESQQSALDRGLQLERKSFQILFATADKDEGIRARLERRPPRFAAPDDSRGKPVPPP